MRKINLMVLCFLLVFAVALSAQIPHKGFNIKERGLTADYWELVTTDTDTSEWYLSYPTMSIYYHVYKWNATSDAPDLTLKFQTTNSSKDVIVDDLTLTISAADTAVWKITDSAIGNGMFWRLVATGGATNDSTKLAPYFDGFPNSRR